MRRLCEKLLLALTGMALMYLAVNPLTLQRVASCGLKKVALPSIAKRM
ncbi:MAG TPA: hypothetical protein VN676_04950 [Steroidobacteraceae bacterium]|nr:hypothetical protein [Steroidobacteraceae bacterium]